MALDTFDRKQTKWEGLWWHPEYGGFSSASINLSKLKQFKGNVRLYVRKNKFFNGGEEKPKKPKKKPYIPPRYTVWYRDDGETTQHCMGFVRYEMGIPVYTNRPCKASWFTYKEAAENVAADCGEGFEVVDMWEQMIKEQRLLRAILLDDHGPSDEDPCEWHGDGTRAEDEDWDGE